MNGEEIAYDSLYIGHSAAFEYDDFDGNKVKVAASTTLDFSVSAQIGQLEANVTYRVKANDENGLVLAKKDDSKDEKKKDGKKPPFKKKDDKSSKDDKSKDGEKPDFKKFKKGKGATVSFKLSKGLNSNIQAAPGSEIYIQNFRASLAEKIADAGE